MKIKLVLLEKDIDYAGKLMQRFQADYAGKLEISSFRTKETFERYLKENRVHIILVDESIEIDFGAIPEKSAFAYLTTMIGVQEINGRKAICKYQKADAIYREILNIVSDSVSQVTLKAEEETATIYLFSSPKGGCGTSTVAAAFAAELVKKGKKTIYLNLETFGFVSGYLQGQGNSNLGDIIFTIKSKKSNLFLKIESTVKTDIQTKVDFFDVCNSAYDMIELTPEEISQIITELASRSAYDAVVIDMDFFIGENLFTMIAKADRFYVVSEGTDLSLKKTERMIQTMKIIENRKDRSILEKMYLIYNRFDEKRHKKLSKENLKVAGVIPLLQGEDIKMQIQNIVEEGYLANV